MTLQDRDDFSTCPNPMLQDRDDLSIYKGQNRWPHSVPCSEVPLYTHTHTHTSLFYLMAELDNEWFAGLVRGEAIEAGNGLVASLLTHVLQETNKNTSQ